MSEKMISQLEAMRALAARMPIGPYQTSVFQLTILIEAKNYFLAYHMLQHLNMDGIELPAPYSWDEIRGWLFALRKSCTRCVQ